MSPLAVITGIVVPIVGQLADCLEFPVVGKFSLQSHPKPADLLHRDVKGETVLVLPVDVAELMHVAKEKLGILQALGFGLLVKFSKIPHFGAGVVEIFCIFVRLIFGLRERKPQGQDGEKDWERSDQKAGKE